MPRKKTKRAKLKAKTKDTLYIYVEPINADFANMYGRKKFGSTSSYINRLIQIDRTKNKNHIVFPEIKRS